MKLTLCLYPIVLLVYGSLYAEADHNKNGLSDVWESKYSSAVLVADEDPDGDGRTNAEECQAGTHPLRPEDLFTVRDTTMVGERVVLRWPSKKGKRYHLQYSASLNSHLGWVNLPGVYVGSGSVMEVRIAKPAMLAAFYRVVVTDVDTDRDGVSDWEELQTGSDPNFQAKAAGEIQPSATSTNAAPQALAQVWIEASDAEATEPSGAGSDNARFVIHRRGNLDPIVLALQQTGTATLGDITALPSTVELPLGVTELDLWVAPVADAFAESTETVRLDLLPSAACEIVPASPAIVLIHDQVLANGTGLSAKYWKHPTSVNNTPYFNGAPAISRIDPTVNFNRAVAAWPGAPISSGTYSNYFSARWEGEILPQHGETYTFYSNTDDGGRLWLNGQLMMDNWPPATVSATERSFEIPLQAGRRYPVVFEYFNNTSSYRSILSWQSASQPKQVIPQNRLFPAAPPQILSESIAWAYTAAGSFSYQIQASGSPTTLLADNLPPGFSVNSTGLITGTPDKAGTWLVTLTATNSYGSGSAFLTLTVIKTIGTLRREVWEMVSGASVADVPVGLAPTSVADIGSLETPANVGDDYAAHIRGYITPAASGDYRFVLEADESAQLLISDDTQPSNAVERARLNAPGVSESSLIHLEAGHCYYLELLHKESAGGDGLTLKWIPPNSLPGSPSVSIPGYLLSPFDYTPAEQSLNLEEIYPVNIGDGKFDVLPVDGLPVDENPPFLFCSPTVATKTGFEYIFRLSQDPLFQQGVIQSSPRRWSYYSPYQPLNKGIWYWQYACRQTGTSTPWSFSSSYSFWIGEEAWTNQTPPFADLSNALDQNPLPRVICKPAELGNLWPVNAALKQQLQQMIQTKAPIPVVLPAPQLQAITSDFMRVKVSPYLTSYVLTLDPKYVVELKKGIDYILNNDTAAPKASYFYESPTPVCHYYELFRDQLPDQERNRVRSWLRDSLLKAFMERVNFVERYNLNEHDWQSDIPTMLNMAAVLYDHQDAQVGEVLEWLYDLWHFRGPVGERNSGSWASHGYFQTHSRQLFRLPFFFGRHTGHNHFDIPWFRNYPRYEAYLAMSGSNATWGDGNPSNPGLAEILHLYQPDRYSQLRWNTTSHPMSARYMIEMALLDWFALPALSKMQLPNKNNPSVPIEPITSGGSIFRDGGFVVLCSNPADPVNNVKVWMRSTPFGLVGHGHPGNNAFTISRGGQPIFVGTGFYSSSGDYFSMRNYKHTRAKNSILPQGNVCEGLDSSGYGWMPRLLSGKKISYCLGDASKSFSGKFTRHANNLTKSQLTYTLTDGYVNPGVTRWRRHLALLENGTLVVYDELEAEQPITWAYTLNNHNTLQALPDGRILSTPGSVACVSQLFSPEPLSTNVTDQWFGSDQAAMMAAMTYKGPYDHATDRNWHSTQAVSNPVQKLRFMNIIRNAPGGANTPPCAEQTTAEGRKLVSADGWTIEFELDGSKPSFLTIRNDEGTAALISGQTVQRLQLGETVKRADLPGTTILIEKTPEQPTPTIQTAVDLLPDAVRYGNLY